MQTFIAREPFTFANGAVGYRPGGPFDCLGPFAKVLDCPIYGTSIRRACYATGYADTYFSIPAVCKVNGKRVKGYLTTDSENNVQFCVMDSHKHIIAGL